MYEAKPLLKRVKLFSHIMMGPCHRSPSIVRLKDSDVTWLYGPLHEHADPVLPSKIASTQDRLDLDDSSAKKSILKHRTISEMLTTPGCTASPAVEVHMDPMDPETPDGAVTPKTHLIAVKSDTNLSAKKGRPTGSPPASARLLSHPILERSDTTTTAGSSEEKRHISFNSRVDQCIAVDYADNDADEYGYSDGDFEEEESEGTGSSEEEGDLLTMKSSPKLQSSDLSLSSRQSGAPADHLNTIAKLAPTLLKTSDTYPAPSPVVVDPTGFILIHPNADAKLSSSLQQHDDDFEERSKFDDEPAMDYFSVSHSSDRGVGAASDDVSILSTPADALRPGASSSGGRSAAVPVQSGHDDSNTSPTDSASSLSTSLPTSSTSAGTHAQFSVGGSAQPRSILKNHGPQENNATHADGDEASPPSSLIAPIVRVGAGSAFIAQNIPGSASTPTTQSSSSTPSSSSAAANSYDSSDSTDNESIRGRSSQRLGSSAGYERIQEAARRSSSGRSAASTCSNQTLSNAAEIISGQANDALRNVAEQERERRGSFRGRDSDGQQRSGAALKLGGGDADEGNLCESFSDDDTDSDVTTSYSSLLSNPQQKSSKRSRNHSTGQSMSPAGSQRLSVDLENLPSNDPAVMGTAPTPGAGGPTPLNTPTLALAMKGRRQGNAGLDGSEASATSGQTPLSPVLPRRTSATGALVAPSGADREAGVRVPLADDFVEEDEGGIVGRAVEIVNTARDLIAAVWPPRR